MCVVHCIHIVTRWTEHQRLSLPPTSELQQHISIQHSMPAAVQAEFLKRNPTKKLVVGVAIDGSALSDRALQTACGLIQQERGDRLVILHVADSR